MALPSEVLDSIATDIAEADAGVKNLRDVLAYMKLAGMDVAKEEDRLDILIERARSYKVFYERQKAKSL